MDQHPVHLQSLSKKHLEVTDSQMDMFLGKKPPAPLLVVLPMAKVCYTQKTQVNIQPFGRALQSALTMVARMDTSTEALVLG